MEVIAMLTTSRTVETVFYLYMCMKLKNFISYLGYKTETVKQNSMESLYIQL